MILTNISNRRNGRSLDDEELYSFAPSLFSANPYRDVSSSYKIVQTIDVINGLRDEGFLPVQAAQSRARDAERREFTKHLVRFRHIDALASQEPEVGEIVLTNAHDGTSAFNLFLGIYRLVCTNGLMAGTTFGSYHIRHHGARVIDDVNNAAHQVSDQLPRVMDAINDMKALPMPDNMQLALATYARDLRWKPDEDVIDGEIVEQTTAPIEPQQLLIPRRAIDANDNSVWTTYQRIQESLMKGGLRGTGANQRRMTTRAVNSVDAEVKLNRSLWDATEQLANYIRQQAA